MEERLNKIISRSGAASRRRADALIREGQVQVNGEIISELGAKADPERDHIRVEGKLISVSLPTMVIMLHKPIGYVTTRSDPEGRPTVMDLVNIRGGVFPIGRLDYNTSGLLLLTNDGELANQLTHPSAKVLKTYEVKVKGYVIKEELALMKKGTGDRYEGTRPEAVKLIKTTAASGHTWLSVTLSEGRNRQVRRMCEAVGHPVIKLKRISIGPLSLGKLPLGKHRILDDREIKILKNLSNPSSKSIDPRMV